MSNEYFVLSDIRGNALAAVLEVLPIAQLVLVAAGLLLAIAGLFRFFWSDDGAGGGLLFMLGLGAAAVPLLTPAAIGILFEGDTKPTPSPSVTPSPTSTVEPTKTPETVQDPADLTWLLVVLGLLLALILAAVLIRILVVAGQRARRNIREGRERVAAELERVQRLTTAWQSFRDRHDELLRKITHAETDWDSLFFTPALTDEIWAMVYDSEFRMLEPYEVKRGMAFPGDYILLGNKREQVRMAGNAVTPNAARDLIAACVESLGYTVRRHYDLVA